MGTVTIRALQDSGLRQYNGPNHCGGRGGMYVCVHHHFISQVGTLH